MDIGPFVLILVGLLLGLLFVLLSEGRPVGRSLYRRYRRALGSEGVLGASRGPAPDLRSRRRRRRRRRESLGAVRRTRRGGPRELRARERRRRQPDSRPGG